MATVQALLMSGTESLTLVSDTPRLDSEVLLASALDTSRASLYAWPEREVPAPAAQTFEARLARRAQGTPISYITGAKEFWSIELEVDETTLIPRPDTECLVDAALEALPRGVRASVLDVGTGTGAIALALAAERPAAHITGTDVVPECVELATRNAVRLGITNVKMLAGDLYEPVRGQTFDVIVSNPPYVDPCDPHLESGDVRFEPRRALVADEGGLGTLRRLIESAPRHLRAGGTLLMEHGFDQSAPVQAMMRDSGFSDIRTFRDLGDNDRVTQGQIQLKSADRG